MAKKHIRKLARILADKYKDAEKILADAGLATQDIIFSPEEQKTFSKYKAEVDNILALLSVSLSAAAQGRIQSLVNKVKEEHETYSTTSTQALVASKDLQLDAAARKQNKDLAKLYASKANQLMPTVRTLDLIRFVANVPVKKKKQKKYFGEEETQMALESSEKLTFEPLNNAIEAFAKYVKELSSTEQILSDPANDLLE